MTTYKLCGPTSSGQEFIQKGNLFIPFDPANTDYQKYLEWLDAGNTPLPADDQGAQP
jgi:hypothetical protein